MNMHYFILGYLFKVALCFAFIWSNAKHSSFLFDLCIDERKLKFNENSKQI